MLKGRQACRPFAMKFGPFHETMNQKKNGNLCCRSFFGGDKRDRTADLLTASQALSQLSYTPEPEHLQV